MNTYQVTVSAAIKAPAAQVYAILADYHGGHPRILPKSYFAAWEVVRGGIGVGAGAAGDYSRFRSHNRVHG